MRMIFKWLFVFSLFVGVTLASKDPELSVNTQASESFKVQEELPALSPQATAAKQSSLLIPSGSTAQAGQADTNTQFSTNHNSFDDSPLAQESSVVKSKFKRESNPSFAYPPEDQIRSHSSIQPHLRTADQDTDDSILIGAIAGLPPPQRHRSLSGQGEKSFGPNPGPTPKPFNRVTGSFFSQTSQPLGSQSHVLHNFPSNQNPKFKILEVKPNRRQPSFSSGGTSPLHSSEGDRRVPPLKRPFPNFSNTNQRREQNFRRSSSGSTVGNSLFVNTGQTQLPVSQTRFGNQEGPIIVHRDGSQGGPTLVHLNNRLHHRLARTGPIHQARTGPAQQARSFGGLVAQNNQARRASPVQFAFPPHLFPVPLHQRDSIAFHSTPIKSVLKPGDDNTLSGSSNSLFHNPSDRNIGLQHHKTEDRFHIAGATRSSPPPRLSRHSPKPHGQRAPSNSGARSPDSARGFTSQPLRQQPKVQPFFFHVDNHNTPNQQGASQQTRSGSQYQQRNPQFNQEKKYPSREYSYGYAVDDRITGDQKKVYESRGVDGVVRGQYSLVQPDGLYRVVTYTADKENGFRANVEYLPIPGIGPGKK